MRLSSLGFLLREAFSGLVRHRLMTLAAVSTSAVCFTVMGVFLAALITLHSMAASFTSELGVLVFMSTKADRADTLAARDHIRDLPGVASVSIVTKEQAWDRMRHDFANQVPLDGVKENPLSDEIHVQLRDVDHIAPVAEAAGKIGHVADVAVMQDVVHKVQSTERLIKRLNVGAAGLLLLATLVVIANVIRLTVFARRREIRVMQLVGATNAFIRTPFLLEGFIYGTVGSGAAAAIVYFGGQSVLRFSHRTLPFLPLNPSSLPVTTLAIALVGTGAVVGLIGSTMSVRRFLQA